VIDNVFIIEKHEQMRELGAPLKFGIIEALIRRPATCQQLADRFGISKQKAHYNLKSLLDQNLIRSEPAPENNKEIYYRACAYNYVLDFSLGRNAVNGQQNSRDLLNAILHENHGIDLSGIAARLLTDCLHLEAGQRLLVTTGKYNMPLVERLLVEAGRRRIETMLIYQHADFIRAKNQEFSLDALRADYEHFNSLLQLTDVYLNLNGESRFISTSDPERLAIRNRAFDLSRVILNRFGVRAAIMPGLMNETLNERDIVSEIRFWKAIDIDYAHLYEVTDKVSARIRQHKSMRISQGDASLGFDIENVFCEFGSFGNSRFQSPIINLPGGSVLVAPRRASMQGVVTAPSASAYGEHIGNLRLTIVNNRVVEYSADDTTLLDRAIREGGRDGGVVALVTLNTNSRRGSGGVSANLRHIPPESVTLYFGENVSFGGDVKGEVEWSVQLDSPDIELEL